MNRPDFDTIINRRGTGSYKWDDQPAAPADTLHLWVADMDFRCAEPIINALQRRVEHGIFGYTYVSDDYYDAVTDWFSARHGWNIDRGSIIYTSGVVPAISAIIKAMTHPGDMVITQTPAYNCFFSSIRNNDCLLAANPLIYDNGSYSIDFERLEELAADPRSRVLLLCNPHNPSGRVWTPDELRRIADIAEANDLFVISDEIHCELTYHPFHYTPYATICNERQLRNCAVCISPSKAFNIAGLQIANIVATDPDARRMIDKAININEVCDVNPFGVAATIAAYRESGYWLDALTDYIHENYRLLCDKINESLPKLKIVPLEGTYLAWVDISETGLSDVEMTDMLAERVHLHLNPGSMYGPGGEHFIRINLACPRATLSEAIRRMISVLA